MNVRSCIITATTERRRTGMPDISRPFEIAMGGVPHGGPEKAAERAAEWDNLAPYTSLYMWRCRPL